MKKLYKRRAFWLALAAACVFCTAAVRLERRFGELALSKARAKTKSLASHAVNCAVSETFSGVEYGMLYKAGLGEGGRVAMLTADTALMNALAGGACALAQQKLDEAGAQSVKVYLGDLAGGQLLSGKGPCFEISFTPCGSASAEYESSFCGAGVNQTRHCVSLVINYDAWCGVGAREAGVRLRILCPIGENIIVGDVPEAYGF